MARPGGGQRLAAVRGDPAAMIRATAAIALTFRADDTPSWVFTVMCEASRGHGLLRHHTSDSAGEEREACARARARGAVALSPPSTLTGADWTLAKPPPTPWTVYLPGGRSVASKRPWSWLGTMKVRRRSALVNFTRAPVTG